jgi:energy-coupling factor transporter ATP-binding protein EcfA2
MRIDSISLHEVGPFTDVRVDFPEGTDPELADVYLLTGPNGCGKTTALYAIAALLDNDPALLRPRMRGDRARAGIVASDRGRSQERSMTIAGGADLATILAAVTDDPTLGPLDDYNKTLFQSRFLGAGKKAGWAAFAYAGTRRVGSGHVAAIAEPPDPFAGGLSFHHTAGTADLAQWIASQEFLRLKAREAGRGERADQIARGVRAIEEILATIVEDPGFTFVSGSDVDLDVRVRSHGVVVDMDVLPDGVQSIVSWIADLLMRLERIPWFDDTPVTQRPFLLLLDEIDIHLHPAWQRRLLPIIQRTFPRAQIIASTHSPFVVGSAGDAHVIAFTVKDGAASVASIQPSQVGVSYSAVLRDIFGIKSEFDVETERMLAEFHAAKTRVLEGKLTDRAVVDRLARELAARGEELSAMLGFELRQLDRRLARPTAG